MEPMTLEQIAECASGLDARDFFGFAERISAKNAPLGETVRLHAVAADGNSPDIENEWITGAVDDQKELIKFGCDTKESASAWWMWKYADGPYFIEQTAEAASQSGKA